MSFPPRLTLAQRVVIPLSVLTLALGLANIGRAILAVQYSMHLPGLPTSIPLQYLAAMGGFWGVTFTACALGLSLFRQWGRLNTLAAVTLYQINAWANRLLFVASDYTRQTVPRDLVLTLILLGVFWIPLNVRRIRQAFRSEEEL